MIEQIRCIDGIDITYKIKKRKYDNNRLIVVFSGFGDGRFFTYDFINSLSENPATIVWIKDDFYSMCSYYMCKEMDFSIERSICKFIDELLFEFGLKKEQCVLAGFSKGGTAALYFGIKYNFKNIISTVPQFNIGSYIRSDWPDVAQHMMGTVSVQNTLFLDSLLHDVLIDDGFYDKNIYLLTSTSDVQYNNEIKPNISLFVKYSNFNLFYAESLLVTEHNQVTSYHVPLILGILNSLAQGAVPRYGYTELKADARLRDAKMSHDPIAILKRIPLSDSVIYPEGISIIKGIPCPEYGDIYVDMVFSSESHEGIYPLAKKHRSVLSRVLYDNGFVNYDKGWFCSNKNKGIDLNLLPVGTYRISLDILCENTKVRKLLCVDDANNKVIIENEILKVFSVDGGVFISKKI